MFRSILCLTILCTGTVYGAVKQIPIRSGVVLKPGETYTAQVESAKPVEIGWTAVQPKKCADGLRADDPDESTSSTAVPGGDGGAWGSTRPQTEKS